MKNLVTRAITGAIYVALIVAVLVVDSTNLYYMLFFSAILGVALWEFLNIVDQNKEKKTITKLVDVVGGLLIFWAGMPDVKFGILYQLGEIGGIAFYLIVRSVLQLYTKEQNPIKMMAQSMMAQMYITLPLVLMNNIYVINSKFILAMFLFIWLNDTGAFCVGSLIGKHRLFERISPKKSWEGFFGGLGFCVICAVVMYKYASEFFGLSDNLGIYIAFGVVCSVFATWGDLTESLIKRTLGVKDSGNILPGHGGMLDRIDSLLLVSPAMFLYIIFVLALI